MVKVSRASVCNFIESSLESEEKATANYNKIIKVLRKVKPSVAKKLDKIKEQEETHAGTLKEAHRKVCK